MEVDGTSQTPTLDATGGVCFGDSVTLAGVLTSGDALFWSRPLENHPMPTTTGRTIATAMIHRRRPGSLHHAWFVAGGGSVSRFTGTGACDGVLVASAATRRI